MTAFRKLLFYGLALALLMLVLQGCTFFKTGNGDDSDGDNDVPGDDASLEEFTSKSGEGVFYRQDEPPKEVADWVDNAAYNLFLGQSKIFGDYLYILVTYGPKPTGGYAVTVTDVLAGPEAITVEVEFKKPGPDENVTQAVTYPYDLVLVPATGLPVRFNGRGAEEYVMTLYGTDTLETIVASSWGIKLFAPAPGTGVAGTLRFSGVASVFEGQINYRLIGPDGTVLIEGYTMAGMGDWCYFREEILLAPILPANASPAECLLELFTISAMDGSEQDLVSITLLVRP